MNIDETTDIGMEYAGLLSDLHVKDIELLEKLDLAEALFTMKEEVPKMGTSVERLNEIVLFCKEVGVEVVEDPSRTEIESYVTMAYEAVDIMGAIKMLLERIWDLLKKLYAYNRRLHTQLEKEIKDGAFSNVRGKDVQKFERATPPFYEKSMLMKALDKLSKIDYSNHVKLGAETYEASIDKGIVDAMKSLGFTISGDSLEVTNKTAPDKTLIAQGWKLDELPTVARMASDVLDNNIVEGKRAVKDATKLAKHAKAADDARQLRRKMLTVQRLVNDVQKLGVFVAQRVLHVAKAIS